MQLVTATRASDVLVVQIIPTNHPELPKTASDIDQRLDQITFSSSLQKDLEALSIMSRLSRTEVAASGSRLGRKLQRLRLHHIAAEDHVDGLSGLSVLNTEWSFLTHLRDQGRVAAEAWKRQLLTGG
jgi:NTE family protein